MKIIALLLVVMFLSVTAASACIYPPPTPPPPIEPLPPPVGGSAGGLAVFKMAAIWFWIPGWYAFFREHNRRTETRTEPRKRIWGRLTLVKWKWSKGDPLSPAHP